MISLTHPTPTTARVRCGPGHDVTMPWDDTLDPWRGMYLVTRGVWLAGGPGAAERYGVSGHQAGGDGDARGRSVGLPRVYELVRTWRGD